MKKPAVTHPVLPDGTIYSQRKNFTPFAVPPLEAYASILSEKKDVSPYFVHIET